MENQNNYTLKRMINKHRNEGRTIITNSAIPGDITTTADANLKVIEQGKRIYFTTKHRGVENAIAKAELSIEKSRIIFKLLAPEDLNPFEEIIWHMLLELGPSPSSALKAKIQDKKRSNMVDHALKAMEEKDAVTSAVQLANPMSVKIWTVNTK